jgi:hypothetical protein
LILTGWSKFYLRWGPLKSMAKEYFSIKNGNKHETDARVERFQENRNLALKKFIPDLN